MKKPVSSVSGLGMGRWMGMDYIAWAAPLSNLQPLSYTTTFIAAPQVIDTTGYTELSLTELFALSLSFSSLLV